MATSSTDAATAFANLAASGSVGDVPLVTYNWQPATQFVHYLAAQANVSQGVAGTQAKIVAVGDSTTLGFGGAANNYRPTVSYPADLATFMSADGVSAQDDNFVGQGNNTFTTPDSRISFLDGANWGYPLSAGGPIITASGQGQGFTFTIDAPQTYDRVDISYLDTGGGSLAVSVDGGPAVATLQIGNTGRVVTQTVDIPLAPHSTIGVVSASANTAYIEGAAFWNSQTPSVQVIDAGEGGAESVVVGDGVTPGAGEISGSAALGANLALINFGINDILQGNLTAAQTTANIALMVAEFRANGADPIIIIPQPISSANYTSEIPVLRADIYQLATSMNVGVIDLSATYGDDWTALSNAGLVGDDAHPNAKLYADIASGIATLLTSAKAAPVAASVASPVITPTVATPPVVASSPTVAPIPAAPATPAIAPQLAPVTLGSGPDTLALQVSEDAYLGDAQFTIAVDGVQIGGVQTATALHDAGSSQTYDILGSFSGPHTATLTFLNDAYAGTPSTDRNLYLVGTTIDGATVPSGVLTEFSQGPESFSFQGPSVAVTGPVVLHLAEDAYLGDAQFTVSIDGQPASSPQTVTALYSAGASQAFNVGAISAGTHDLAVSFVNDLYAGTPTTDRNLYVTGIDVRGTPLPNATAAIYGDWTSHFTVVV